ncbi:MAG: endonuclease III, partial [Acidobacteria bacterium]|nr:endonuclease III [Acidobacteriota bacterium]
MAARAAAILAGLTELYPDADCELAHVDPFQLLVATILSAQTTDRAVNQVTPALFARFPEARALSAADPREVEPLIAT